MRNFCIRLSTALAVLAALSLSSAASHAKSKKAVSVTETESGYGYDFKDEPLEGLSEGASGLRIRMYPRATRRTLIRPRISFVPEMLKSVEQI